MPKYLNQLSNKKPGMLANAMPQKMKPNFNTAVLFWLVRPRTFIVNLKGKASSIPQLRYLVAVRSHLFMLVSYYFVTCIFYLHKAFVLKCFLDFCC